MGFASCSAKERPNLEVYQECGACRPFRNSNERSAPSSLLLHLIRRFFFPARFFGSRRAVRLRGTEQRNGGLILGSSGIVTGQVLEGEIRDVAMRYRAFAAAGGGRRYCLVRASIRNERFNGPEAGLLPA